MNGAQHILEAFHRHNISTVFGYPGGCIMPLYDALVDDVGVEHVLCRHEQGCALAADGYARASGKLGVCIATSGPGATNLITGVANAHRDSIPMLVITGQVPSGLIGTDAFQETDVLGMTLGIVKHSYLIDDADSLPTIMEEAIELAQSGRPGPVWIDIPKDLLLSEAAYAPFPQPEARETASTDLTDALAMLRAARKPLLYSGGGISLAHAEDSFRAFAESSALPAVVTLKGIGNPGKHNPYNLGMLGMHGSRAANKAVDECDLLLVIGARLDDRATGKLDGFAPNARMIHIDADAAEINKLRDADLAIRGDLNHILKALAGALQAEPLAISEWQKQCRTWYTTGGFHAADNEEPLAPITGPAFIRQLSRIAPDDTVIACDVGQHQMWVAQHYDFDHPRHHLTSGGLGTMGFGLPAAMGVKLTHPDDEVLCITGEGSIQMNIQELSTCKQYNLPVKIINLNNQALGMVKQWQDMNYESRHAESYMESLPDFIKLAEAYGHKGVRIEKKEDLETKLKEVLAMKDELVFVDIYVDRFEHVYPMQVARGSMKDMWLSKTERV